MIFKRPYGFLIKHFRLIHLLITGILIYIVKFTSNIYKYIGICIYDSVNRYNALEYINYNIYIWLVIVLGLLFIILWLFKYKDKPRLLYIISIIGYLAIAIYIFVIFSYFTSLPNEAIEQKTIRFYQQITLIFLAFQYIIIINMIIRGLGFNIKKFNFAKDIQELDLNETDNEEIEVDLNIDTNTIMRGVRKKKRELGYFYQEFKIIIITIILILLFILGFSLYKYISNKLKYYNQDEYVGYNNYISINKSYYNIDDNGNYIIIKFSAFKNNIKEKLNINNIVLSIDGKEYLPNKNICSNFSNIGNCYKKQYITNDIKTYILVYKTELLNIDKTYILYKESHDNTYKIKLALENIE